MWHMNEKMLLTVPKPLLHRVGKAYLNSFRKKAKQHMLRQENGSLHPFDWEIEYRDINKNEFMIKIKKCGFITYADKFDARASCRESVRWTISLLIIWKMDFTVRKRWATATTAATAGMR